MKKILVCVKMVPIDHDVKMDNEFHMERSRVLHQLNIADMSAVEAALRCKPDAEVTVLTMGTKTAVGLLQDLFTRGVDRVILLTDRKMAGSDSYATAVVMQKAIEKFGPFDLILCGRKAVDGETGQVPGELSAALGIPCITNVSKIEISETAICCSRLLEMAVVTLKSELPVIVSLCEYSYSLRLPSIRMRRQAAGKEVEIYGLDDLDFPEELCGQRGSKTKVLKTVTMETGLRSCTKENDLNIGVNKLISMIKENRS